MFVIFLSVVAYFTPIVGQDTQGLYIQFKTKNPSTDANAYIKIIDTSDTPILHESYFFSNLWDRKKITDTLHRLYFSDRMVHPGFFEYQVSYFDTVRKMERASAYYFFRLVNKNGALGQGIYPRIGPFLSLKSHDTLSVSVYGSKSCFAVLKINYRNRKKVEIDHNKLSKRHEFILYAKDVTSYRLLLIDGSDTFVSQVFPVRYSMKYPLVGVFGDTRANWASPDPSQRANGVNATVLHNILKAMYADSVNLIVVNGDLISGYTSSISRAELEYDTWMKATFPYSASVPILPVPGNHDMTAPFMGTRKSHRDGYGKKSAEYLWKKVFSLPDNGPSVVIDTMPPYKRTVYYLGFNNWGMFFLNSDYNYSKLKYKRMSGNIDNIQLSFLKNKARDFKHIIVFFHEPCFPVAEKGHALDYAKPHRDSIWACLTALPVKLVVNSHEHIYARRVIALDTSRGFNRPLSEVIVGTGGAPIYTVPDSLIKKTIKFSNETVYILLKIKGSHVFGITKNTAGCGIDKFKL